MLNCWIVFSRGIKLNGIILMLVISMVVNTKKERKRFIKWGASLHIPWIWFLDLIPSNFKTMVTMANS